MHGMSRRYDTLTGKLIKIYKHTYDCSILKNIEFHNNGLLNNINFGIKMTKVDLYKTGKINKRSSELTDSKDTIEIKYDHQGKLEYYKHGDGTSLYYMVFYNELNGKPFLY